MHKPDVFREDETRAMRAGIQRLRQPGSYEEGRWMVSSLNRRSDIVAGHFRDVVHFRDTTLRATELMPGVVRTEVERRQFLAEIVKAGVSEVMTSSYGKGHSVDEMRAEVAVVKDTNPECKVVYGELRSHDDLALAAAVGHDVVQFWSTPWIESAPIYSGGAYSKAWRGDNWRGTPYPKTIDEQIERAKALVAAGTALGVKVSVGINMLSYASDKYITEFCTEVAKEAPYEITLLDAPSGVGPEAFAFLVRLALRAAPNCRIGVHPQNGFGLATATCLAAAREGAHNLEVAVNGYYVAAGQSDLASVATALHAIYGVPTGIDLSKMTALARYGEEYTGYALALNHPVTGREAFNWGGSDVVVQQMAIDPLIHWSLEPSLVGNERKWAITRGSGPLTILDKLVELGIDAKDKAQVELIRDRCLALISRQRAPISDAELRRIADEAGAIAHSD